jgi:hypothetical protein
MSLLGRSSSLSPYAGPYVSEMLGKGAALADMPYTAYQGPLTAGPSSLQNQMFQGLAGLAVPSATMTGSFTGQAPTIPTAQDAASGVPLPGAAASSASPVSQYMNPYIEAALNPTIRRVGEETAKAQQNLQSQYAKAGGYGGGRQAVAEAGLQNRALDRIGDITAQGYATAYDKAADMFDKERNYGLTALDAMGRGGAQQRDIEQAGITADLRQFEQERDYPYKQVQYMQSLLQGLPISTQEYQYAEPSGLSNFMGGSGGILGFLDTLGLFGE